eukprot:scaffold2974_cov404-Prasinococcus_capsulatus_cf.AAC.6
MAISPTSYCARRQSRLPRPNDTFSSILQSVPILWRCLLQADSAPLEGGRETSNLDTPRAAATPSGHFVPHHLHCAVATTRGSMGRCIT